MINFCGDDGGCFVMCGWWCGWGAQVDHSGDGEAVAGGGWGGGRTGDAGGEIMAVMLDLGVAGDVGRGLQRNFNLSLFPKGEFHFGIQL
ncbi:hypothetical protein Acr_06g0008790 [Actinidia rufa]|uniref:Uncharacterized protein n=1 Tax=Actinidia rufa TaxID=165716 RepID=A0A7J0ESG5_9ERIC|nr:hypothetical protein Acr_06g0008790 [Actinidia rufa]